jgi:hypothetical protein
MASVVSKGPGLESGSSHRRANALADRLEQGARALAEFASALTEAEWHARLPHDGRKIGVVVHHVATMYPLEIRLAQMVGRGEPVVDVTWQAVATINAEHARANDAVHSIETGGASAPATELYVERIPRPDGTTHFVVRKKTP